MDLDLVMVKGLVYFGENWSYATGRLLPPVGPPLVNRSKGRGQTKSDPKDPHEKYKKDQVYPAKNRVATFNS